MNKTLSCFLWLVISLPSFGQGVYYAEMDKYILTEKEKKHLHNWICYHESILDSDSAERILSPNSKKIAKLFIGLKKAMLDEGYIYFGHNGKDCTHLSNHVAVIDTDTEYYNTMTVLAFIKTWDFIDANGGQQALFRESEKGLLNTFIWDHSTWQEIECSSLSRQAHTNVKQNSEIVEEAVTNEVFINPPPEKDSVYRIEEPKHIPIASPEEESQEIESLNAAYVNELNLEEYNLMPYTSGDEQNTKLIFHDEMTKSVTEFMSEDPNADEEEVPRVSGLGKWKRLAEDLKKVTTEIALDFIQNSIVGKIVSDPVKNFINGTTLTSIGGSEDALINIGHLSEMEGEEQEKFYERFKPTAIIDTYLPFFKAGRALGLSYELKKEPND